MDVVYFVVLVGALVFVHELGHFALAKIFGVKVLRFSVGFGPKIVGFSSNGTEYVLAVIPLGGYVKLLGDAPHDVVPKGEKDQSLGAQPVWRRSLIVAAGPAMNLLFPLLLFFLVHLGDDLQTPATIGTVFPERPADGRLLPGDRVVAVDGDAIETFDQLRRVVRDHPRQPLALTVEREGQRHTVVLTPVATQRALELGRSEEVGRLGIDPYHRLAVVGVQPGSAAHQAGLRSFDRIVAVAGEPVDRWIDLQRALEGRRGAVPLTYLRGERVSLGGLAELEIHRPRVANVRAPAGRGSLTLRSGIESGELYVREVIAGSAEDELGLRPGDRLVSIDGRPLRIWASFLAALEAEPDEPHELVWRRGTQLHRGTLRLPRDRGVTEHGLPYERIRVGVRPWLPARSEPLVETPNRIVHAAQRAVERTGEMLSLTFYSVLRLVQGRLSVESLGGPLTIFDAASDAAREGATNYLVLMAFISVNLAVLNLLPIPLLDGGHLLFYLVEAVTRREVPVRLRARAALMGLILLVALTLLAVSNDLRRAFSSDEPTTTSEER
jgi:regulator of sigma E protease